jgi:hypothetical protein
MRITARQLIYAYVALVILEGAIRKWLVPGGVGALVAIARDPIALYLVWYGWRQGLFVPTWLRQLWLFTAFCMAASGLLSLLDSNVSLTVFLFGLRTNLLHFPLVLIIPGLLNGNDLQKLLKRLLALAFPIALIMVWQYRSPLSAWINTGAIEGAAQVVAVVDTIRPPGPFSFITGAAEYFALINAVIIGSFFDRRLGIPWIVYGLLSTILALSVSGSRLMTAMVAIVWVGSLGLRLLRNVRPPRVRTVKILVVVVAGLLPLLAFTPLGGLALQGWETTSDRFEVANTHDGGFFNRFQRIISVPDSVIWETPLFGYGLGLGTNFGARAATGAVGFALAEAEMPRIFQESGVPVGVLFLVLRVAFVATVLMKAWRALGKFNQLPISLCFANITVAMFGQIARPTSMGFVVLSLGFSLAASRFLATKSTPNNHRLGS